MYADIKYIRRDLDELKEAIKDDKNSYVTKTEFDPIKKLVYGCVALILSGFVGAILTLIMRQ